MLTHFLDQYQEACRDGALLDLWLRTLIDVARTAPMEHITAARLQNVYAWPEVLLAILPGFLPLLLPPQPDRIDRLLLLGLAAVYLLLLTLYLRQNRPVAWALPVLGLAGTYTLLWGFFILLDNWRWFGENIPYPLIYLLPAAAIVLAKLIRHGNRLALAPLGILLLATLVALHLADAGFPTARAEALEAPALILLAAALGLPFAGRYGYLAGLFVAGSAHWAVESTIDPSLLIRFGAWPHLLALLSLATTLILIPILALRARSGRVLAILLPLAACLLLLIVLPPLVYSTSPYVAGGFDAAGLLRQSLHHTLYAIQILAGAALALTLYGNVPSKSDRLSLVPDNWLTH